MLSLIPLFAYTYKCVINFKHIPEHWACIEWQNPGLGKTNESKLGKQENEDTMGANIELGYLHFAAYFMHNSSVFSGPLMNWKSFNAGFPKI